MRWSTDPLSKKAMETRIVEKFLWFPKCIGTEWRWWERVKIKQMVRTIDVGGSMQFGRYKHKWCDMSWVD